MLYTCSPPTSDVNHPINLGLPLSYIDKSIESKSSYSYLDVKLVPNPGALTLITSP